MLKICISLPTFFFDVRIDADCYASINLSGLFANISEPDYNRVRDPGY